MKIPHGIMELQPDSGSFSIDKVRLAALVKNKNHKILGELGGVEGIISNLRTNPVVGIHGSPQDLHKRRLTFGAKTFRKVRVHWFVALLVSCFTDISNVVILVLSMYFVVSGIMINGWETGWKEGTYTFILFLIFFIFSTIFELGTETYLQKATEVCRLVIVLRNGLMQQILYKKLVVGDVVYLKKGDKVPADGLFLDGHSLELDESKITGLKEERTLPKMEKVDNSNPFLSAGAEVIEGHGTMFVTSVGRNTMCYQSKGEIYSSQTILESKTKHLEAYLEKIKWVVAFSYLPISLGRYFSGNLRFDNGNRSFIYGETSVLNVSYVIVEILLAMITISIAMDTSCFTWAIKFNLARAINKLKADNVIVKNISSLEKAALGIAEILIEKSGTSTVNVSKFVLAQQFAENEDPGSISQDVLALIRQGIGMNTTGIIYHEGSKFKFLGSPTERAILSWGVTELSMDLEKQLHDFCVVQEVTDQDSTVEQDSLTLLGLLILIEKEQEGTNEESDLNVKFITDKDSSAEATDQTEVLVSMGSTQGDEVLSDIVICDGNFAYLPMVIRWGRCNWHNTQTFLQFQLTVNITSMLNTFIAQSAFRGIPQMDTRLTYVLVQLIWVNLFMALIVAVNLGRENPSDELESTRNKLQLVTGTMWRNLIAQVVYQLVVLRIVENRGEAIFNASEDANQSITFVMPIFFQVFNMINARKIGGKEHFFGNSAIFDWTSCRTHFHSSGDL
ncbi:Calcium-transporting ATPase 12 [Abeliophyllum distichum]|uniref:Calcium-transporting ATPase 12 n=1 Tax=Abeliophyllum distichum TaxID=126358 RepID=A0ABD1RIF4_9LAMI